MSTTIESCTNLVLGEARRAGTRGGLDSLLLVLADALTDLESLRIATAGRLRALIADKGIPTASTEATRLAALLDGVADLEHGAELQLKAAMRAHPLGPWVARTKGVGEKQAARLLAAIGDPAERRTVSQLWAYCGYHVLHPGQHPPEIHTIRAGVEPLAGDHGEDAFHPGQSTHEALGSSAGVVPSARLDAGAHSLSDDHRTTVAGVGPGVAPHRRKGQRSNWNGDAKTRAYLVAESCIKNRQSPYRAVYDAGREKYTDALHSVPCPRCGPTGKPAPVGSPLSSGHQHARAMRLVAKAILRDLWVEARRLSASA